MKDKGLLFFIVGSFLMLTIFILTEYSANSEYLEIENVTPKCEAMWGFNDQQNRILKVPADFPRIATAVANSEDGDWIIISPGAYFENEIVIDKAITISSEWKISGDESVIEKTIIDSEDKVLFTILKDSVEVSGLMLINGNHTLDIEARATIIHNHFINNLDGISMESNGGGYVAYNIAENDRDDPLDIDIIADDECSGSDILVEHNVFINSNDDGIEIRLFKPHNQNIKYTIRHNKIIGSKNAAIQLISYDEFTGKEFHIHHNIFTNCKTGLGCMEGARTQEDLSGATKMDEIVYFYNNTVTDCQMGATGGNRIIAFNNLIAHNSLGGFKLFGANSDIRNNLLYDNGSDDFVAINSGVVQDGNIFGIDPLIDANTYSPAQNSPCIDGGIASITMHGDKTFTISPEFFTGNVPDIGGIERGHQMQTVQKPISLRVDAGENQVVESSSFDVVLAGRINNPDGGRPFKCDWKQEKGPAQSELINSGRLVASANLPKEGIYQFSINCSDGQSTTSGMVTIRNIKDGEGKQMFLSEDMINSIEAEDFAYAYGNASMVRKKFLRLEPSAQVEFSVGMPEGREYELWLLIKSLNPGENKIGVEFNQQKVGELSIVKDKKFQWVKVPAKIETTPGQWQLLINNLNGQILLEKIIFSYDKTFVPY